MHLICEIKEVGINPNIKISSSVDWKFSNSIDILKRIQKTPSIIASTSSTQLAELNEFLSYWKKPPPKPDQNPNKQTKKMEKGSQRGNLVLAE